MRWIILVIVAASASFVVYLVVRSTRDFRPEDIAAMHQNLDDFTAENGVTCTPKSRELVRSRGVIECTHRGVFYNCGVEQCSSYRP